MGELALQIGSGLKWLGIGLSPILLLPFLVLLLTAPLKRIADGLITGLDGLSTLALFLAKIAAILMVFAQLCVIAGRYVFGWSASWLNELVVYGFAAMFLLAAASALKFDAHVRVDIFRSAMSVRTRQIIELVGLYLFLFPVCILILWAVSESYSFAESWVRLQGSRESDGLPIYYIFRTFIPVFAILMILQGLSEALKSALIIRGERQPPETHDLEHGAG